ncbi:MAG: ABC transporter permease [Gemmatimonadaceae bacterium]
MGRIVLRRLLASAAIVFAVASFTFVLIHLAPGDAYTVAAQSARYPGVIAQLRAEAGLDRPIAEQYVRYMGKVARGDFGKSFSQGRAVHDVLADAIPNTLVLMGAALACSFLAGIALGIVQARAQGSPIDRGLGTLSLLFYSMPDFWLAILLLLVFGVWVNVLPTGGVHAEPYRYADLSAGGKLADRLQHLVLPVAALTLLTAAAIARYQRSAMLDVSGEDYVRTARAKGLGERGVVMRHVLRNALLPVITLVGLGFPALLGGAVLVEKVFSWPGMGSLTVDAVLSRDFPLVTAAVVIGSAMVCAGSLLADLLYAVADPRMRRG